MNARIFLPLLCTCLAAHGEDTALDALRLLPKDAAKRLARIEAREGAPGPERWYLLVHEPAEERGVREFVVADGKLAGSRTLSQFADALKPADVFGADAVKIDSTHLAKLASVFAEANGVKAAVLNYELARDAATGAPVWSVTVLDAAGDQLGTLIVNATKGAVISSDGFEKTPDAELLAPPAAPAARSGTRKAVPETKKSTPAPSTPKPNMLQRIFGTGQKPAKQ